MTTRRRIRKRPLTDFANRSWRHALAVWLIRSALILLMGLAAYLLIVTVILPGFAETLVERMQSPTP